MGIAESARGYNPFGMLLVWRNWQTTTTYKYGFNGKENVDDVYGNDVALDFGSRVYDARLGRWFSLDPKFTLYPSYSSYATCLGNPIFLVDTKGEDVTIYYEDNFGNRRPLLILTSKEQVQDIIITAEMLQSWNINPNIMNWFGKPFKKKLGSIMRKADGRNLRHSDAVQISFGFQGICVIDVGASFDMVMINNGFNAGDVYYYITLSTGFGVALGGGISVSSVDYNEGIGVDQSKDTYKGISLTTSGGVFVVSFSKTTAYTHPEEECLFYNCDSSGELLYESKSTSFGSGKYTLGGSRTANSSFFIGSSTSLSAPAKKQRKKDQEKELEPLEPKSTERNYTYGGLE